MRFMKSGVRLALATTIASTALIGLSASGAEAAFCGFWNSGSPGQGTGRLNFTNCQSSALRIEWDIIGLSNIKVCVRPGGTAGVPSGNPVVGGLGQARGGSVIGSC
jgi:hypothetical protein